MQQYQQCIEFSHVLLLSLKQLLPLHLNQSQAFKIHQIAFSVYTNRHHWCQTLNFYVYGQVQQLPTITDRLGTTWENPLMHVNTDITTKGCSRVPVHTRQPIKDVSKSTNWQHTCVFSLTNPTTQNSDYFLFKDPLYPLQSTLVLHTLSNFPIRSQEQALHFSRPGTVLYFKLWIWPLMIFCRGWWLQQDLIKELICYISIFIYPKSLGIPSQTLNIHKMKPNI